MMQHPWEQVARLLRSNLGLKALALIIALGLWFAGHRDIERSIEVPIEFRNLPSDLMMSDNRVDYVVLRLMGPRTLISTLDSQDLKLSMDLGGARSGAASYPLGAHSFDIPRGVTVARITPAVIHLRLEPVLKRVLPVAVRFSGKPAVGYRVFQTNVEPESISVQGPADDVKRLASVETIPIDLAEATGVLNRRVRLLADGKPLLFSPDQVDVSVTIDEEIATREFDGVEVKAKGYSGAYAARPRTAYVKLSGPKRLLDHLTLGADEVYLDLKGLPAGEHAVPLTFNLPPRIKVVEQKPQQFRIRVGKSAS